MGQNANGTTHGADKTFVATPNPPTAVTNAATGVGGISATLNGTVNAKNNVITVTFQYGTTTSYGTTVTAAQSPVSGITDTAVSAAITGLLPNTTYHFRVVAQDFGIIYGADMSFTTGSVPTAVTNAASAVGASGATLNGTVNADNTSMTVTFEYGLNTGYGKVVTASQSPVTASIDTAVSCILVNELTPNTTYHYRVKAQNGFSTTYGADKTFLTVSAEPTATTRAATNIGTTSATLNGLINANNNSTTVTFQFGTDTNYGRTVNAVPIPVTGSDDIPVSADITGLVPNTTYHFRVVAENSSGTAYGADLTFFIGTAAPTVTTAPVTKITFHTAKSGGNVIDEGAAPVTARGVCWSTSPNPTIADSFTTNDFGPGPFNSTMNQLTEKTTYYVRPYATNSYAAAYGEEFQFTTNSKNVKVKIVQPLPGEEVSGTVTIKVNAKGTAGSQSITKVEVYIDGTKIAELTNVPFKTRWDSTTSIDGSHTIKAMAYNKNNESSQESITMTVNNSLSKALQLSTNRDRLIFTAVPIGKKSYLVPAPRHY